VGTAPGPLEAVADPIVRVKDLVGEREALAGALAAVIS
jgi:hypothetical protein